MGDGTDSSSGLQTLASVLAGGLAGYVDAQNSQPVTVTAPSQQTAYGYAGYGQATPSAAASAAPSWLIPVVLIGVVALLLFKR
jgi:hypothetical protein